MADAAGRPPHSPRSVGAPTRTTAPQGAANSPSTSPTPRAHTRGRDRVHRPEGHTGQGPLARAPTPPTGPSPTQGRDRTDQARPGTRKKWPGKGQDRSGPGQINQHPRHPRPQGNGQAGDGTGSGQTDQGQDRPPNHPPHDQAGDGTGRVRGVASHARSGDEEAPGRAGDGQGTLYTSFWQDMGRCISPSAISVSTPGVEPSFHRLYTRLWFIAGASGRMCNPSQMSKGPRPGDVSPLAVAGARHGRCRCAGACPARAHGSSAAPLG